MQNHVDNRLRWRLKRIANEAAELPVARWIARPAYRRIFLRRQRGGNSYFGVFDSHAEALAAAGNRPSTYDFADAGSMYRELLAHIRVSDYPPMYWLSRLIGRGERRIFDLGGHIGVSYYGFGRYLDYPDDLQWLVHDVPSVLRAGREWAARHDARGLLRFTDDRADADGCDVLACSGTLQYLDYDLAEFLGTLSRRPPHVLVSLAPMHPTRAYFTLQNIGDAVLPYRVHSIPGFVAAMQSLGYEVIDDWQSHERYLHIPFAPEHAVDFYSGFVFRLAH